MNSVSHTTHRGGTDTDVPPPHQGVVFMSRAVSWKKKEEEEEEEEEAGEEEAAAWSSRGEKTRTGGGGAAVVVVVVVVGYRLGLNWACGGCSVKSGERRRAPLRDCQARWVGWVGGWVGESGGKWDGRVGDRSYLLLLLLLLLRDHGSCWDETGARNDGRRAGGRRSGAGGCWCLGCAWVGLCGVWVMGVRCVWKDRGRKGRGRKLKGTRLPWRIRGALAFLFVGVCVGRACRPVYSRRAEQREKDEGKRIEGPRCVFGELPLPQLHPPTHSSKEQSDSQQQQHPHPSIPSIPPHRQKHTRRERK